MKSERIIKALFAATITIIAVLCAIPAFAAEVGDIVNLKVNMDYEQYIMNGELETGVNTIDNGENYSACYEFNAEKAGYYLVSNDSGEDGGMYIYVAETYDGTNAAHFSTYVESYNDSTEITQRLYYLEEGINLFIVDRHYHSLPPAELTITYFGDEIADITYDEKHLNFIIGNHLDYSTELKKVELYPVITMTNGNVFNGESSRRESVWCSFDSTVKTGENSIILKLPGCDYKTTAYVYAVEDIIESIEFSHTEKYTKMYEYYNGLYGYHDPVAEGETVTVNYTDGTCETISPNTLGEICINLPEGPLVCVIFDYIKENEKTYFVANISGREYMREECESVKVNARSNYSYFAENITGMISEYIAAQNFGVKITDMASFMDFFRDFTVLLKDISNEFSMLISFYI